MTNRVVVRRKTAAKPKPDLSTLTETFRVWALKKEAEANAKAEKDSLRVNSLFPMIESAGVADDKGSLILNFAAPVSITSIDHRGVKKSTTYLGVKKERRVSPIFLEDVAAAWLKENKLIAKVEVKVTTLTKEPGSPATTEEHTYLDQNLLYVLNQEGKVPDEVLDSFFEDSVTWALVPVKS